jgi:nucleotide-binding universal stress UspA family protein
MKILVPLDDSKFSEVTANGVISLVRPNTSEIRLLHVLEEFPLALAEQVGSNEFPAFPAARLKLRDQAKVFLERIADRFRSGGFEASYLLEEGDPREVILDYAARWPADLIFVGSHGRKGMSRFLLGSVAYAVAHHAHCSVQIVKIPSQPGGRG